MTTGTESDEWGKSSTKSLRHALLRSAKRLNDRRLTQIPDLSLSENLRSERLRVSSVSVGMEAYMLRSETLMWFTFSLPGVTGLSWRWKETLPWRMMNDETLMLSGFFAVESFEASESSANWKLGLAFAEVW